MKGKHLFSFLLLLMVAVNSWSRVITFDYTYKGCTLLYSVEGDTKTVNVNRSAGGNIADGGTVYIPSKVSYDGNEYTVVKITEYTFRNDQDITRVIYPSSLTYVGSEAFQGCTNLVKFDMYDSSSKNCLINGNIRLGDSAFEGCGFQKANVDFSKTGKNTTNIFKNCDLLEEVVVYGSVPESAFEDCSALKTLTYYSRDELKECSIGYGAFKYCNKLEDVSLNGTSLEVIADEAFYCCWNITNVELSSGLKIIEAEAFRYCSDLKVVNVNSNLESIDKSAFAYCGALTFNFKGGVTEIPDDLFNKAQYGIYAVTFPSEGLKRIGKRAFKGCGLSDIGQIVCDEIGEEAFYGTGTDILDVSAGIIGKDACSQMTKSNYVRFRRLTDQMQPCFRGTGRGHALLLSKNASEYESFGINIVSPFYESEFMGVAIDPQDNLLPLGVFRGCNYLEAVSFNNPAGLESYTRIASDCPKLIRYDLGQGKPNGYLFEDGCVYSNTSLIFAPEGRKSRIKLPSTITHIGAGASYSSLIYDMTSVQEAVNFVRYADLMEVPTLILTKKLADKFEAKYKGTAFLESLKSKWILQGDMNGDGQINVSDVTSLVNVILNK